MSRLSRRGHYSHGYRGSVTQGLRREIDSRFNRGGLTITLRHLCATHPEFLAAAMITPVRLDNNSRRLTLRAVVQTQLGRAAVGEPHTPVSISATGNAEFPGEFVE